MMPIVKQIVINYCSRTCDKEKGLYMLNTNPISFPNNFDMGVAESVDACPSGMRRDG